MIDYSQAVSMLRTIDTTDTVPLVRAPKLDNHEIGRLLDAGAEGHYLPARK